MNRTLFVCFTDPHGFAVARSHDGERFVCRLAGPAPHSGWVKLAGSTLIYSPEHTTHPCIAARVTGRGPSNRPSPARSVYVTEHNGAYMVSDGGSPLLLRVGARARGVTSCSSGNALQCKLLSLLRDHDADYIYTNVPLPLPGTLLAQVRVARFEDSGGGREEAHSAFVARIKLGQDEENV